MFRHADGTTIEGDGFITGHARAEIGVSDASKAKPKEPNESFAKHLLDPQQFLYHVVHSTVFECLRRALGY